MKICVYCASSEGLDPIFYEIGEKFGETLAKRGHSLVFGGYNKGIMASVARGVFQAHGEILAVIPKIFDRPEFSFEGNTETIATETMHERKKKMEEIADGFAILPGGIGTFDEFFELLVLKSLGEIHKPLAILNVKHCYDLLEKFLDQNTQDGFLQPSARAMVSFYTEIDELLDVLEGK